MTSNINSANIDEAFPVAGKDNDTQGFRNNFGIIKSNFATANAEITDLQETTARNNTDNSFGNNIISNAILQQVMDKCEPNLSISSNIDNTEIITSSSISYSTAPYHLLTINTISDTYTVNLINWPSGIDDRVAKLTVELISISGDKTISWTSTGITSADEFKTSSNWPTTFTVPGAVSASVADPIIVEFWTHNGGTTVFANYLGKFS